MKPKLLEATLGGGRLLKRTSGVLIVAAFGAASLYGALSAFAAPPSKTAVDAENASYAQMMLDEGKKTFRYETFGSEAFWGDTLQLHKAIAGEKNGGVGPGVSPKTALSVGLKVDADALPDALKQQIKAGKVNLDDPATTIALLKLNAVVGVTAFANPDGSVKSMGIQCAFCHSTVDNSFAPGIGKRLDGWANRDLNVGAIVSLAPNLKPFTDLLGVDVETEEGARQLGARPLRRGARQGWQGLSPRREAGGNAHPARVRTGRREPLHLDRLRIGHLLERLRRRDRDAWRGNVLRCAVQQFGSVSRCRKEWLRKHPEHARQNHSQAGRVALLSAFDPGTEGTGRVIRRDCIRTGEDGLQRLSEVRNVSRAAALFGTRQQFACARRDRHRCIPSRPLADSHVPHVTVSRDMDASEAHQKGGFFHDGRFATLLDVVNHYDTQFNLNLSNANKRDLVEYLKGI